MKYITLTTVNDIYEAQILRNALEDEGIPCMEANENVAMMLPHLRQGVQILVKKTDYLKAKIICDRVDAAGRSLKKDQ
jgi:hypothetical protein